MILNSKQKHSTKCYFERCFMQRCLCEQMRGVYEKQKKKTKIIIIILYKCVRLTHNMIYAIHLNDDGRSPSASRQLHYTILRLKIKYTTCPSIQFSYPYFFVFFYIPKWTLHLHVRSQAELNEMNQMIKIDNSATGKDE